MGLMSTLALLALPLLKRPEKPEQTFTGPSLVTMLADEVQTLKARVAELEAEVDRLNRYVDDIGWDNINIRRELIARADYERATAQQQQSMLQQQWQNQAQAQPFYAHNNPFQQAMQTWVGAQDQLNAWGNCTCVPGRSAAFGILRREHSDD